MDWGRMQAWRDFVEQPERWAMAVCAVAVLILIGVEISGLIAGLRTPVPDTTAHAVAPNSNDADRITRANLFGQAPAADQSLPQTQLQLTLRGVFTSNDPQLASAIVETADGKMQIVRVGGHLGSNTSLQRVYADHVVIDRDGVLESLPFPVPGTAALAAATPPPAAAPGPATTAPPPADDAERRANILRRLEELRARGALSQ